MYFLVLFFFALLCLYSFHFNAQSWLVATFTLLIKLMTQTCKQRKVWEWDKLTFWIWRNLTLSLDGYFKIPEQQHLNGLGSKLNATTHDWLKKRYNSKTIKSNTKYFMLIDKLHWRIVKYWQFHLNMKTVQIQKYMI